MTVRDRMTAVFLRAIRVANLAFTRYPESDKWLVQRLTDDFMESAISIRVLAAQGAFNVGRREMRYLIEAAVKHVFVDQQVSGDTPLADRPAFLGDLPRRPGRR